MDPIEVSALGGAGSAFVAALSYWAKTRHERRRSTRAVLYYLLELHHVVHRVRAAVRAAESELPKQLKSACQSRGVQFAEGDVARAMAEAKSHLFAFGRQQLEALVVGSSESYEKSLADLARENPVLAFRLRGRDQMTLIQQKLEIFSDQSEVKDAIGGDNGGIDWARFDAFFLSMALEELRTAIRATAWGCDAWTHFSTLWLLRFQYGEELSNDLRDMVKHVTDNLVGRLVAQAAP